MDSRRLRLPIALTAAVAAAEAAVLLLRPRAEAIEPAPVDVRSYFSAEYLDRARRFRRPQLALYGARLALDAGLMLALARRPPRRLRGPFRRPLLADAGAGAALSAGQTLVSLPLSAVSRRRAKGVGLVTQSWGGWAVDVAKSTALGSTFAGAGSALLLAGMRRLPRTWWIPGAGVAVAVGAGFLFAGPVLLDPLFNRFSPLPEGRTRRAVLDLARRAGVEVGEVYEVDASRRTTAANAYVTGLGPTKRVVLFDTLLERFEPEEADLVVAHELAHVRHRDLPRGVAYIALVAPAWVLAAARLAEALAPADLEPGSPAVLPAVALAFGLVTAAVGIVANQLSRRTEAVADADSLRLTGAPQAFIASERLLAEQNVADPDPPRWLVRLLGTHPSTLERIGAGEAFAAGAR